MANHEGIWSEYRPTYWDGWSAVKRVGDLVRCRNCRHYSEHDQHIIFSPERNQWTLTDGRHHMEVPEWARGIMRDEFERETRPLRDSLDLALDSKRIAERRVTELLAENAKLRELVQRMHGHIKESCDECDGWYCSNFDEDNECCVYDTLARELGVEVD